MKANSKYIPGTWTSDEETLTFGHPKGDDYYALTIGDQEEVYEAKFSFHNKTQGNYTTSLSPKGKLFEIKNESTLIIGGEVYKKSPQI